MLERKSKKHKEELVNFNTRDGKRLNGVLHHPISEYNGSVILLVHSGIRGRIGNTRQYVYYAREFSRIGYYVFRFDPHGLGYSDGHIEPCCRNELYNQVQKGIFVNDTLDAVEYIISRIDRKELILMGLCGGAITSLIAGAVSADIDKLILLGCPVRLDSVETVKLVEKEFAKRKVKEVYIKKLFSLRAWWRLLTGKSKDVFSENSKARHILQTFFKLKSNTFPMNKKFISSIKKIAKYKTKILFFFGSNDLFTYEFENEFEKNYPHFVDLYKKELIVDANHMFTQPIWQTQILNLSINWLTSSSSD